MAKLGVAYGLCPLVDNSSLLGVSVDSVPDCVIVTVGKNIVIRYKFQDQKQVSSWSSKDKLTSPVVYNSSAQKYTAIFNYDILRMWDEEDQLDKVKKYKFQEPLHCIIPDTDGNTDYILFRSGYVTSLAKALDARKSSPSNIIQMNESSVKEHYFVTCNDVKFVVIITCNEKDEKTLVVVPVLSGISSAQYTMKWKEVNNTTLVGYTVMSKDNVCYLYSLWSDGCLFSFKFLPSVDEVFPGTLIYKVTSLSCKLPVAITPISDRHLALFGADSSDEGASLLLLNLAFQLIQSRLHFKLYTKHPRLWNVSNHLLMAVGNNLIAVPYHEEVEQLSTLLGTHSSSIAITEISWAEATPKNNPIDHNVPTNLGHKIKQLMQDGCSQASILQNVLPQILKENDVNSVLWCLNTFSDVPESCVVQILNLCFAGTDCLFQKEKEINVTKETSKTENAVKVRTENLSSKFKKTGKQIALIDAVLNVTISDVCIMPHLRGVPFATILGLLSHLCELMERESPVSPLRVVEWLCLLLDSHYQDYLLSHSEQVVLLLSKLNEEVNSQIECLRELKKLTPLLHKLQAGEIPLKVSGSADRTYSIENLQLY